MVCCKVAVLVAMAAVCWGQTPDLKRQLVSGVPREVAWAAYSIGVENRVELVPELAALVAAYKSDATPEHGSVRPEAAAIEAVADALIRLQAKLPADTAMHLYPEFPAQTMILLSRATGGSGALMDIFQSTKHRELWLAAGNLLVREPPAGFAHALLRGVVATFEFRVVWTDDQEDRGGGGGCAGDFAMIPDKAFADWPKVRMYSLHPEGHGGEVFAAGIHPVSFSSWATTDYNDPWEDGDCTESASRYWRSGLVAQLQGKNLNDLPLTPRTEETVRYTSDGQFEDFVKTTIEKQARAFGDLVESFVRSGALSVDKARDLHFQCLTKVWDYRPSPHTDLPEINGKWCTAPPDDADLHLP